MGGFGLWDTCHERRTCVLRATRALLTAIVQQHFRSFCVMRVPSMLQTWKKVNGLITRETGACFFFFLNLSLARFSPKIFSSEAWNIDEFICFIIARRLHVSHHHLTFTHQLISSPVMPQCSSAAATTRKWRHRHDEQEHKKPFWPGFLICFGPTFDQLLQKETELQERWCKMRNLRCV